jgi:hypothetical protein
MIELLDREEAARWFAAGACVMRLDAPSDRAIAALVRRSEIALAESGTLPPPGVLQDLGSMFRIADASQTAIAPMTVAALESEVRLYEDRFLARVAEDRLLDRIRDALSRLEEDAKERASAIVASRMLARLDLSHEGGVAISPAIVRRQSEISSADLFEIGHRALREPGRIPDLLARGYAAIVRASRRQGALLVESDAFLAEHILALERVSERVAIEQMIEAADHLSAALPKRMKPRKKEMQGRALTRLEDQDQYPVGGFSSMSTSGTLENLVTSELIYMEDGTDPSDGIDLFDLRYVEGELLYYTRDESQFLRRKLAITFILEPGLERARFKDAGVAWQRLVLLVGLLVCAVRKLSEWLREEELRFSIVFAQRPGARATTLAPELELLRILFAEEIERELVEISEAESVAHAVDGARAIGAEIVSLRMSDGASMARPAGEKASFAVVLDLGQPLPELTTNIESVSAQALDRRFLELLDAWRSVTKELLQHIVDLSGKAA